MCCLANTTASCNVYYYAHDIYYIYLKVLLGRSLSLSLSSELIRSFNGRSTVMTLTETENTQR